MNESKQVIKKIQCSICASLGKDRSGDNLAVYEDGGTWCFSCNQGQTNGTAKSKLIPGTVQALPSRALDADVCGFFGIRVGKHNDQWVRIYDIQKDGKVICQKLKDSDKNMTLNWIEKKQELPLWGQWKFAPNDKLFVTITEGEDDAAAIAQVQGMQYPVVSVPNGASGAKKAIEHNLKWLMGFKYVVLAFDNDLDGKNATQKCLSVFEPGKVRVAEWPEGIKDANEMLIDGRGDEIKNIIFRAKANDPEHLVTASDIIDKVMMQPQRGIDYPWPSMSKITYGQQDGEIHIVVGANGIGKTEFMTALMFHSLDQGKEIGLFSFEQSPENTLRRLVGAKLGLKLHLPGTEWNSELIRKEAMELDQKIFLCERTGSIDIDELFLNIKFLAKAKNKKLFIIDNLRGLGIGHDTEMAGDFMKKLQAICQELKVTVFLLSHVAKNRHTRQVYVSTSPKNADAYHSQTADEVQGAVDKPGLDWETGRQPSTIDIDGPSVIGDLADYIWSLGRNKTSQDKEESTKLKIKCLKARLDGSYTGHVFNLIYGYDGKYTEKGDAFANQINCKPEQDAF